MNLLFSKVCVKLFNKVNWLRLESNYNVTFTLLINRQNLIQNQMAVWIGTITNVLGRLGRSKQIVG